MALATSILQSGTRGSQPAAAAANNGCYYRVTDEGNKVEQSTGSAWVVICGGWLEEHAASASASLVFTTCITSAYDTYVIELRNILPATDGASLLMRVSTDGGSTYDSSGIYDTAFLRMSNAGSASGGSATAASRTRSRRAGCPARSG